VSTAPVFTRRRFLSGSAAAGGLALAGCTARPPGPAQATRRVVGARGPVLVPEAPSRVAALIGSCDVDVLALGITPVYAGTFAEGWVDLPFGIVTSDAVPPSVEAVAATRPDLLLGWEWLVDDPGWARLGALAPAVPIPEGTPWQEAFLLVGDAVNRRGRAEAELAAFEARVAQVRARVGAGPPIAVGQIGFTEAGVFRMFGEDRDSTRILRSAGLTPVGAERSEESLSLELLGQVRAPWLIAYGSGPDGAALLAEAKAHPLWSTLPAVRAGRVLEVDGNRWVGAGFLWARAILDDVERLFGGR
jgi:iron complex transport system substrate-binding protein